MSGVHKNPTISFRISDYERREIEARIKASGMMKKTFITRCCIYGCADAREDAGRYSQNV